MRSRLAFGVATVFAALMDGGAEGGGDARPAVFAGNGTLVFS
jgi:hypothetical protein